MYDAAGVSDHGCAVHVGFVLYGKGKVKLG
jgi:hypothetical protein